jgi:hypothetical protein
MVCQDVPRIVLKTGSNKTLAPASPATFPVSELQSGSPYICRDK